MAGVRPIRTSREAFSLCTRQCRPIKDRRRFRDPAADDTLARPRRRAAWIGQHSAEARPRTDCDSSVPKPNGLCLAPFYPRPVLPALIPHMAGGINLCSSSRGSSSHDVWMGPFLRKAGQPFRLSDFSQLLPASHITNYTLQWPRQPPRRHAPPTCVQARAQTLCGLWTQIAIPEPVTAPSLGGTTRAGFPQQYKRGMEGGGSETVSGSTLRRICPSHNAPVLS
jgi:hypothetical protein